MTNPNSRESRSIGQRLRAVGFYAVANDYERGRLSLARVVQYLRRDAPKVTEPTQSRRFDLADELEEALR